MSAPCVCTVSYTHLFKYFNEKYGYAVGDQVLKEFSNYLVAGVRAVGDVYMTRVAGDQFAVYLPYRKPEDSTVFVERMNRVFERQQAEKYPEASLRLRSGIYEIEPDCLSASAAKMCIRDSSRMLRTMLPANRQPMNLGISILGMLSSRQ